MSDYESDLSIYTETYTETPADTPSNTPPDALPILYRDEALIAINKPSGLLVHRSNIDRHETDFALQRLRNQIGQRVYPLHRLDKPTSGVLMFALSSEHARLASALWSQQRITKRYLCVVRGHMSPFVRCDKALSPTTDDIEKKRHRAPEQDARTDFYQRACTELDVMIDKYPTSRYALLEAIPHTGRKHQLRRHLKHLSHPIIGDARYGKGRHSRYFRDHLGAGRLLLHAWQLSFTHPITHEPVTICAPLDATWQSLMQQFQWQNALPPSLRT